MSALEKVIPASLYGRLTLLSVFCEAIAVIVLESYIAGVFIAHTDVTTGAAKGIPVYLIIFIWGQAFQIYLSWDAIRHKNTIQIIGFVLFNAASFAYSIFQYFQMISIIKDSPNTSLSNLKAPLILIPVFTAVFVIIHSFLSFKLYLEFGWKIYKKIGADPKMRNMYRAYQIFLLLLKLDLFFFLAFSAQFLYLVLDRNDPEYALTIAALPITIVIVLMAVYGLKREDRYIMLLFMFSCLLAIAYFIFKITRIHTQSQKYADSRYYLTFFSALTLICVLLTLANALVCHRNFGSGLKQHLLHNKKANLEATAVSEPRRTIDG